MKSKGTRRTVLVTGGAGYVGGHACKALTRAGYAPVVYDNLSRGHALAVKWGPFERGDLLNAARLAAVIKKHRPVAVLHFAALAYVGESVEDPLRYFNAAGADPDGEIGEVHDPETHLIPLALEAAASRCGK